MKQIKKMSLQGTQKKVGLIFLTILFTVLAYLNFLEIISFWETNNLGYVFASQSELSNYAPKVEDLWVMGFFVLQYILISGLILSIVSLIKFKEGLKSYKEPGVVAGLITGLITGSILGLITGLIVGSILGLIVESILGLIFGSILGLITGLIVGSILGLISGLIDEFKK